MPSIDYSDSLPEIAYYYPERYWHAESSGWVKSLLLFFDGVALLLSPSAHQYAIDRNPELIGPLLDDKLLHFLDPSEVITPQAVDVMAESVIRFVKKTPNIDRDARPFTTIGLPTIGGNANPEMSTIVIRELRERGLIDKWESRSSSSRYRVHPIIEALILCIWARTIRAPGRALGLELLPTTNSPNAVEGLVSYLRRVRSKPTKASLVEMDLQATIPSLDSVPLDEILDFRRENGASFRAYQRSLNQMMVQLSMAGARHRQRLLQDRQAALFDARNELRRRTSLAFNLKTGVPPFLLGIAGSVVGGIGGGVTGVLLAAAGGALASLGGLKGRGEPATSEFSYLFRAEFEWMGRA